MKKYLGIKKQIKVSLLVFLYIASACSKSSDVTPETGTSYVSMKVNGVVWKSSLGAGAISQGSFSLTGALETTNGQKEIIAMTLVNSAAIGVVYKLEENNERLFQFTKQREKVSYFIGKDTKKSSGTLTITKTKAVGSLTYANATFAGTAIGSDGSTIIITEGVVINSQVN